MKDEDVYKIWRGAENRWVAWVKPIVFAGIRPTEQRERVDAAYRQEPPPWGGIDTSFLQLDSVTAIIVDLEGREGLLFSLALGTRGYRPVVVINTCSGPGEVIDLSSIRSTLLLGAQTPSLLPDGPDFLPAFVLDARRMRPERSIEPGALDNRWMVFRSDLPSGMRLREGGLCRVLVVQRTREPQRDLHEILWNYRRDGFDVTIVDLLDVAREVPFTSKRTPWIDRLVRRMSLPRNFDGSFGRRVPWPSHG